VSSRHARITIEGGGAWIEDLASSNGTWLDGKRIAKKSPLESTSIIRIGRTTLMLESVTPDVSSPGAKETPWPERAPAEVVEAEAPLAHLVLAEATLDAARQRLSAVYELSSALSEAASLDAFGSVLLDHLLRVFARPEGKLHAGLLLGPDLILQAYRPEDEAPTCSLTLARDVLARKNACLWRLDDRSGPSPSASLIAARASAAMYVPLVWNGESLGVLYLDATSAAAAFGKDDLRLAQIMAIQAAMFIKNFELQRTLQKEAILKTRYLAQFPRSIAERLARLPDQAAIPSERVETVTVLFSDVRGFTKIAATMEPEDVVRMLNEMFHDLTPIILKNGGTVDKYLGDALLAVFGSPDPDSRQWEHAIQSALEIQEALRNLASGSWRGQTPFRVGIGLHTGPAIHGFVGAPERMEYTVIGHTINVASRFCAAAAPGEILISPEVYARVHHSLEVDHPPREVETKHEGKMKAYLVRGWKAKSKPPKP
jgi:adenylate cyclase